MAVLIVFEYWVGLNKRYTVTGVMGVTQTP
jgi:hypothetical protein